MTSDTTGWRVSWGLLISEVTREGLAAMTDQELLAYEREHYGDPYVTLREGERDAAGSPAVLACWGGLVKVARTRTYAATEMVGTWLQRQQHRDQPQRCAFARLTSSRP